MPGSLMTPGFVSPRSNPFRVYALLEIGIALLGILVWFEVPLAGRLYAGSGSHGQSTNLLDVAARAQRLLVSAPPVGAR